MRAIKYADVFRAPNAEALLSDYAAECRIAAIGVPKPDLDAYDTLEKQRLLQCFGVYADDDVLIGFGTVLVSKMPHYSRQVAIVESIFIARAFRTTRAGIKLLRTLDRFAQLRGCPAILYSAPAASRFERMLANLDSYQRTNSVYCRSLA